MQQGNHVTIIKIKDENFFLIKDLLEDSKEEGFHLIERTVNDWETGVNRFAKHGEVLWGLLATDRLIGICGLNVDPFTGDKQTGRVRHLFIKRDYRRQGYGTFLMQKISERAKKHFKILRLYTDNASATAFYQMLGFTPVSGYKVSHVMSLTMDPR